ncbi:MAG: hypothetical protein F4X65_01645 [Chloroflexi bacterium]|nr:hypothetical protein [Chloroflexota bacterium]
MSVIVLEGGIYGYIVPAARAIAGYIMALILAIGGGWAVTILNAMIGYPWVGSTFFSLYIVGVGLGAGLGAYLAWINLSMRWYVVIITVVVVMLAGIAGSTIGYVFWEPLFGENYLGPRDSQINATHFWAPIGAIVISSLLGLFFHFRTRS